MKKQNKKTICKIPKKECHDCGWEKGSTNCRELCIDVYEHIMHIMQGYENNVS